MAILLSRELYYCTFWEHRQHNGFETCVSSMIEHGQMLQIHCIALSGGKVLRGYTTDDLRPFEASLRKAVRNFLELHGSENKNTDLTVKVWYYEENGDRLNTNDIPLRIAITFYRPIFYSSGGTSDKKLREALYAVLHRFIKEENNESY